MKKRTVLFFSLAAVVLALAFLAPIAALRAVVAGSLKTEKRMDASAYVITTDVNLLEKLASIPDPAVHTVILERNIGLNTLASDLRRELDTLQTLGAILEPVYNSLDAATYGEIYVDHVCMIRPSLDLVFDVYQINLWEIGGNVLVDAATGKVLLIHFSNLEDGLFELESGTDSGTGEVEGWAAYFDLNTETYTGPSPSADTVARLGRPFVGAREAVLKEARLRGTNGASVVFGLRYQFAEDGSERYTWGVIG